jgi:hypothetical protein
MDDNLRLVLVAFAAALPASIAALSSIRNGIRLKKRDDFAEERRRQTDRDLAKALSKAPPDWYKAPDLD